MLGRADQAEKLHAGLAFGAEDAAHDRGGHNAWRANAARGHAEMLALEHNSDILCSGNATDLVGNLLTELLLQLEPMGKLVSNTREL